MNSEGRFLLAVALMIGVLITGNLLFPPPPPPEAVETSAELATPVEGGVSQDTAISDLTALPFDSAALRATTDSTTAAQLAPAVEEEIVVEHSNARITFSTIGARITSVELPTFASGSREGSVQLVDSAGPPLLGARIAVDGDTFDLRAEAFVPSEHGTVTLQENATHPLTFRYDHPSGASFEVEYLFRPGSYIVEVRYRIVGVPRGILITDLGAGLPYNEVDRRADRRGMAYVLNHLQEGVRATAFSKARAEVSLDGPFLWAAMKSQYFVAGILPGIDGEDSYLGGVTVRALPGEEDEEQAEVEVSQSFGSDGEVAYRFYAGPQDYALLTTIGSGFQEVSPVGWRWLRPVLRPIIGVIMWVFVSLHETLSIGYGWVLILVGILMRIVLFPLNHKAMRAQLRNMAVQPLLKEIQTKYKDQPDKMQKELMRLYKEHGFNPLAGCWPLLLPWPILIALFFVFQHTIELRGVSFAWFPDLAAKDPIYILPVLLGISMFLLQWISFRTMEEVNPQMKMMMWMLPIMMVVLFANLPSGLNLYYLSTNIATLPQSWWIAQERKKVQVVKGPSSPAPPSKKKG